MDPRLDGESDPVRLARENARDAHTLTARLDEEAGRAWLVSIVFRMQVQIQRAADEHFKTVATPAASAWKTERPTMPGLYWVKGHSEETMSGTLRPRQPEVVKLEEYAPGAVWFLGTEFDVNLHGREFDGAEWMGPLEIPQ